MGLGDGKIHGPQPRYQVSSQSEKADLGSNSPVPTIGANPWDPVTYKVRRGGEGVVWMVHFD